MNTLPYDVVKLILSKVKHGKDIIKCSLLSLDLRKFIHKINNIRYTDECNFATCSTKDSKYKYAVINDKKEGLHIQRSVWSDEKNRICKTLTINYINGILNGSFSENYLKTPHKWGKSIRISITGTYHKGKKNGLCIRKIDGKISETYIYQNDRIISTTIN